MYRYEREYNSKHFKFLYCEGNRKLIEQFDYFPETHTKGHTSYVRVTDPKRFGHNRLHTYYAKDGLIVDHINRNGLDNRLCNLRLLTKRENSLNRTDNVKDVGVYLENGKWIARIKLNGKYYRLGKWKDKKQAILAYRKAKQRFTGIKM